MRFFVEQRFSIEFMQDADFARFDFVDHLNRTIDAAAKRAGAKGPAPDAQLTIKVPTHPSAWVAADIPMITIWLVKDYERGCSTCGGRGRLDNNMRCGSCGGTGASKTD